MYLICLEVTNDFLEKHNAMFTKTIRGNFSLPDKARSISMFIF